MTYNSTKSGVDTMDYKTINYTVARISVHSLMTISYALINIEGINSQVNNIGNTKISRFHFLKTLRRELMIEHVKY